MLKNSWRQPDPCLSDRTPEPSACRVRKPDFPNWNDRFRETCQPASVHALISSLAALAQARQFGLAPYATAESACALPLPGTICPFAAPNSEHRNTGREPPGPGCTGYARYPPYTDQRLHVTAHRSSGLFLRRRPGGAAPRSRCLPTSVAAGGSDLSQPARPHTHTTSR